MDMNNLREVDGYEKWRETEAYSLSDLVQRRIRHLQNPQDCSKAKKLVCNLNKVIKKYINCFLLNLNIKITR